MSEFCKHGDNGGPRRTFSNLKIVMRNANRMHVTFTDWTQ